MGRTVTWAVVAVALLGACGDSSAEDTRRAAPSSSTTTTFDREAEEAAVIAAYLAQLEAFYLAANPPDPDHPALAETTTGPLLDLVRGRLTDLRAAGLAIRKGEASVSNPRVIRVSSAAAVVEDCGIDGDITFESTTDRVTDDSVIHGRVTARLIRVGEAWRVETSVVEELEAPCA